MKRILQIPRLPLWILAVVCWLVALVPTYPYVRLIPGGLGVIFAGFALMGLLKGKVAKLAFWAFIGFLGLAVLILGTTGVLILLAGTAQPEENCPYIVVLGAKTQDGDPGDSLTERIDRAGEYLKENPNTVAILSGGQGEAACMFAALRSRGIEENRLWIEENAASTWENLKFSIEFIEKRTGTKPERIGVVSSEFHLFRVGLYAEDQGIAMMGIPAKTENPLRWLNNFIREIAGVWHYFILGGQYD